VTNSTSAPPMARTPVVPPREGQQRGAVDPAWGSAAPRCDLGSPGPVHALIYKRGFVDGFGLVPLDLGPDAGVATMPWRRGGAAEHGSLVGVEDALERSIVTAGQTAERKGRDDRVDPRT
jgi:hypothetical protein